MAEATGDRRSRTVACRGILRVFLGIGPGAGKTAAMLRAALAEKNAGRSVVIGNLQAHGDKVMEKLAARLSGARSPELDLEEVLAQQPEIVVLDDLAHTNPAGARHPKRFQDALELMEAGVTVYTTLNIYELASRADLTWELLGLDRRRLVSDGALDKALIDLVDVTPDEMVRRYKMGSVLLPPGNEEFARRLFQKPALMALREMAARLFAERIAREVQEQRQAANAAGPAKSSHRLLLAIEADWDSEPIIMWTRRLAGSLNANWIVLYVETSRSVPPEMEARLTRNLDLARELGAEVITTADNSLANAALRIAKSRNVTQIVAGKTAPLEWWRMFSRNEAVADLVNGSGDIGVHVVPVKRGMPARGRFMLFTGTVWQPYAMVVATVVLVALAGWWFMPHVTEVGAHAMAFVSLLAVIVLSLFVERGPALLAAALSATIWDYFFLPPVFAFRVSHVEDALLLAMYFVVALAFGQLTTRIRAQETAEREREKRATVLYLLGRELAEATTVEQIVQKVVMELGRTFDAAVAILLPNGKNELEVQAGGALAMEARHLAVAAWVRDHRRPAGRFTENLPMTDILCVPLETPARVVGVIALRLTQSLAPTIHQRNLLEALTRQIALAFDRQRLSELSERAKLLSESERLGKTLLDSMSHEIRTPVAAIKAAASDLAEQPAMDETGAELIAEIQEAAERLNRLVRKVLDITRLESKHIKPQFNECEVNDIVNMAVAETEKDLAGHKLTVDMPSNLPLIRTDFVFLQQALMNLLSNAASHTPPGTAVELRVWEAKQALCIAVADRGPGLPPQAIERVFDKFYRGPSAPTGGTGLGLSLVRGFVEALGGKVTAENPLEGGARFTISMPLVPVTF